jgi:hypothetical protein
MQRDKMKVETEALFTNRMAAFTHEESDILMEECNNDLEVIESFVLVSLMPSVNSSKNFRKRRNSSNCLKTSLGSSTRRIVMFSFADILCQTRIVTFRMKRVEVRLMTRAVASIR